MSHWRFRLAQALLGNGSRGDRFSPMLIIPPLAGLLLLAPVFLSGKALFWGTPLLQFTPWWAYAAATLRSGGLPLWNPWLGMGAPLAANYQTGLFYPPNWAYLLAGIAGGVGWIACLQALLAGLHLAWAALGMMRLARRLGLGELAQALSGLAFACSGYLVARAGFLSLGAAAAWLPWILAELGPGSPARRLGAPVRAGKKGSKTWRAWAWRDRLPTGLVICLALQLLAGHAQTSWYSWLLALAWAAFWGWRGLPGGSPAARLRSLLQAVLRLGLALGLACSLAAVQLLPTAEYLLTSQRAQAVGAEYAMTYSLWPWRLLGLVAPQLFGDPATGDYWGYGNYWEDAAYIGLLPLFLAVGVMRRRRPGKASAMPGGGARLGAERGMAVFSESLEAERAALARFLTAVVGVAILLALGKNTPVYPWLYDHVPTFNLFQAPARWLLWAVWALALLAGLGVEGWRRPQGRGLYWTRLGTMGALAVGLGAGAAWLALRSVNPSFIRAVAGAGLWGLGAGWLALAAPPAAEDSSGSANAAPGGWRSGLWRWGVLGLVGADLLSAGWGLNPGAPLSLYGSPGPAAEAIRAPLGAGRLYLGLAAEQRLKFERYFHFASFAPRQPGLDWSDLRNAILPNLNLLDGLAMVNNFDPLTPGRYTRWMERLDQLEAQQREPFLNLMGVTVVEELDETQPGGVRFVPRAALPRLRWVPCAQGVADGEAALALLLQSAWEPARRVVLEAVAGEACDAAASGEVRLLASGPQRVELETQANVAGYLVFAESWYPGWQARLDGAAAPLLRADYLFQAVALPAGRHRLVLEYRPLSFFLGAAVSLAAWAGLVISGWRRSREAG